MCYLEIVESPRDNEGPEITKDDLRAFIGGSDKCRSKEVYDYIAEQREVEGSWIKQWFDDFIRKCNAEPEEIDWLKIALSGDESNDDGS